MIRLASPRWLVAPAAAALLSAPVSAQMAKTESTPPRVRWAGEVWESANRGDDDKLIRLLRELPDDSVSEEAEYVERFRQSLERSDKNRSRASQTLAESRAEAIGEMREHVAEDAYTKALRSAIQVQDLSDDFDLAFEDEDVRNVIAWAEARLPETEAESDWLAAQELLYLLRTLHEDTDRHVEYKAFDKHLDRINRRVTLLALYAPRNLHDLRVKAAERDGEEPISDFNPATAVDWKERVEAIDHRMLKAALRIAAREHIETEGRRGWRVLMEGGLEALKLMASTPGLEASFPALDDANRRDAWVKHLDGELTQLEGLEDADLDSWKLSGLIDRLIRANARTVELPNTVLYREFGDGAVYMFDAQYDDPYSEIIWPDKLRRFQQATEGNFIGVGILIRNNEKREIMVVNPLEGTPAYFAGVKPNDLIVQVDGESTVGWSLNDAVDRITGPKDQVVVLGLKRENQEDLVEIPVTRDVIKLRSVKGWWKERLDEEGHPDWNWYIDPVSRIAYIRLTQFTEDTYNDLRAAWDEASEGRRPLGLILDLRYNPGGLLTSAVQISNLFIEEGVIVSGEDKHGRKAFPDQRADPRRAELLGVPTVVLTNKGSASASEIVAGCLQAHGAAVVVGERSYGKGSVQTVHHIANDGRLKLTTHYYRLPPAPGEKVGRLVHKRPGAQMWGVEPDIEVRMTTQQVVDSLELRQDADIIPSDDAGQLDPLSPDRPDVDEMLTEGLDPQLQTALLILQARAMATMEQRHAKR